MIFGDLGGKTPKNLTQKTCADRGSNLGPLRDRRECYHLTHSGGLKHANTYNYCVIRFVISFRQSIGHLYSTCLVFCNEICINAKVPSLQWLAIDTDILAEMHGAFRIHEYITVFIFIFANQAARIVSVWQAWARICSFRFQEYNFEFIWPKFPDICLTIERKPRKKLNQEIDPTGERTRAAAWKAMMLLLDHSGGPNYFRQRIKCM